MKDDEAYLGNTFTHFDEAKTSAKNDVVEFCDSLLECLHTSFNELSINLKESVTKSLNTQLWLRGESVAEKMSGNESSHLESSESEDEGSQGDTEIYKDKHRSFSFADKNIDIIGEQFRTPMETSGCNIPDLKTEFLNLFNHVKNHISINTLSYVESW